ncbi:hypothetical protein [Psychromonas sp. Urea-02u-13]|uniref:hypothetical protein n=1 Tax=Psychromonas sp. Urea-02u-13 TaxID=2058326 RepID=UPI000C345C2D|nr:hypothetical protein [Psychromonas sp. Urea-02u-13]PKG39165.1 hypothetical protein CXF74_09670 [Psychromonas sp. Urea-02u-13]
MLTIFVSDIFGQSLALQALADKIAPHDILIIDPYAGQLINFENEQVAYDYFSDQVSLPSYAALVLEKLNAINQPFNLIAFSVGGSATWLKSARLAETKVKKVFCFYSSQIRHHLTIQPNVPIELILPQHEKHFDINELASCLTNNKQITLARSLYAHGFMNQLSENFNQQGYDEYSDYLRAILQRD